MGRFSRPKSWRGKGFWPRAHADRN